jgi:hypothetical protein
MASFDGGAHGVGVGLRLRRLAPCAAGCCYTTIHLLRGWWIALLYAE